MTLTVLIGELSCLLSVAVVMSTRVTVPATPIPTLRSPGRIAVLLGMAITTASSTFVVAYGPEALRVPFVVVAVLLAPGYAVVAFRRLDDAVDELALALAVSFALLVLVGTVMASTRAWEPIGVVAASTVLTAPALAGHATYLFLLPVAATTVTAARD